MRKANSFDRGGNIERSNTPNSNAWRTIRKGINSSTKGTDSFVHNPYKALEFAVDKAFMAGKTSNTEAGSSLHKTFSQAANKNDICIKDISDFIVHIEKKDIIELDNIETITEISG